MIIEITSIINAIFDLALVICAIVGVYNYHVVEKRKKIEKAVSLAKYYKENVLLSISAICDLYEKLGIDKIIDGLDINKMINLDVMDYINSTYCCNNNE